MFFMKNVSFSYLKNELKSGLNLQVTVLSVLHETVPACTPACCAASCIMHTLHGNSLTCCLHCFYKLTFGHISGSHKRQIDFRVNQNNSVLFLRKKFWHQ